MEFLAGIVPGLLVRSHYTEARLSQLVEVDLRTTNPVVVTNQTMPPGGLASQVKSAAPRLSRK